MYSIEFNRLDKQYRFKKQGRIIKTGSLQTIACTALECGLSNSELTVAFEEMNKNKHVYANFGLNGTFIFSK